ncbi:MAG TPA: GNAT family N-acetyltransferase, partial [Opitutaceae bacterium]|nr:GNAT family N-acetyltransferase [Opitutaceae bacterium]
MSSPTYQVVALTPSEAKESIAELRALLRDAVENGASVGFVVPLSETTAEDYWNGVIAELDEGSRLLWVARDVEGIRGTIQLGLCQKPNGRHRGEVQKLLVHSSARRRGIGSALMAMVEESARGLRRHLLYLDTEPGQPAELMY